MYTVGFANQFYTLWSVTTEIRATCGEVINSRFTGSFYEAKVCTYYKNLSTDYDEAIRKIEQICQGGEYAIDLSLKGESRELEIPGTRKPAVITEDWQFNYGKLRYEDIRNCDDEWQLDRVYTEDANPRRRVYARRRLIELGKLVRYNWVAKEYDAANSNFENDIFISVNKKYAYREQVARFEQQKAKSDKSGFFFKEGERVSIKVKEVNSFSFETNFGRVYVVTLEDQTGKYFYYKGGSPANFSTEEFEPIVGTVKHNEYKGLKQTLLQRIKK